MSEEKKTGEQDRKKTSDVFQLANREGLKHKSCILFLVLKIRVSFFRLKPLLPSLPPFPSLPAHFGGAKSFSNLFVPPGPLNTKTLQLKHPNTETPKPQNPEP